MSQQSALSAPLMQQNAPEPPLGHAGGGKYSGWYAGGGGGGGLVG